MRHASLPAYMTVTTNVVGKDTLTFPIPPRDNTPAMRELAAEKRTLAHFAFVDLLITGHSEHQRLLLLTATAVTPATTSLCLVFSLRY